MMAIDFFEAQHAARKKSRVITWYLVGAVTVTALAVYLLLGMLVFLITDFAIARWHWQVFAATAGTTVAVVGLGGLYKTAKLRKGGRALAQMLRASPVSPGAKDPDARMLLNVVEEMAIASGLPVPPVYMLDREPGINALAAGFTTADAVIVVTRGCTEQLTRDELQGVIAHEFSHILNGDMRLNLRLVGVLHGLLLISLHGRHILESGRFHPAKFLGIIGGIVGVSLVVIGSAGRFCGRLIKAAVSRQREFLADAAAVQFTRYPAGLAGALQKVRDKAARVNNSRAAEADHMFFADALCPHSARSARSPRKPTLTSAFRDLLATHPAIEERILRLESSFDQTLPSAGREGNTADKAHAQRRIKGGAPRAGKDRHASTAADRPFAFHPGTAVASVGEPGPEHLEFAAALVSSFPDKLVERLRDPSGAAAVSYALLLSDDENCRRLQLDGLADSAGPSVHREVIEASEWVRELSWESRFPLAEMALPSLRNLSPDRFNVFRDNVRCLIAADRRLDLFEVVLQRILVEQVRSQFEAVDTGNIRHRRLGPLLPACDRLLSTLARAGHDSEADAADAFVEAARLLSCEDRKPRILPQEQTEFEQLNEALELLAAAAPAIKRRIMRSCAACVEADGFVTVMESELLRVIALSLDCPMPPLQAGNRNLPDEGTEDLGLDSISPARKGSLDAMPKPSRAHRIAIVIVWAVALLTAGAGIGLLCLTHGYAGARREIERLGGEWVEESHHGTYGGLEFGPYVSVSFEDTTLNDDGLGELAPWLPFLARFYRPLEIDLAGAQISDAGLAALRGNKCLRYLNLGGTQVSDRGLVILKECPNIEYLCLAMNPRITDQGLATAGGLRSLRALDLTVTAVTDAGLVHLEPLKELRYLRLWGTEVTDVGRSRMRESIPKLQIDD